jgi:hypothetical protein
MADPRPWFPEGSRQRFRAEQKRKSGGSGREIPTPTKVPWHLQRAKEERERANKSREADSEES